MPAKSKKRLCSNCRVTRDQAIVREPPHLVHPVRRQPGLYDVYGHADCPQCGARWHRGLTGVKLVG